jgi:lipoprotein-anchoring transpeptidase ErfK/SrfK
MQRTNWTPWIITGGAVLTGLAMMVSVVALLAVFYLAQDRMPEGIQVEGVSVGGQSAEDARSNLNNYYASRSLVLTDEVQQWVRTFDEFGLHFNLDATLQQVEQAGDNSQIAPVYDLDLGQTHNALIALNDAVRVDPAPGQPGRMIDIPNTLDRLNQAGMAALDGGDTLKLSIVELAPLAEETAAAVTYDGPTTTHTVQAGQELGLIAKEYGVSTQDIVAINGITNPDIILVGQELVIPAAGVYMPTAAESPVPSTTVGKAIVVSTQNQRIYAYENGELIHSHLVSTGRNETPTLLGDFKIYVKYVADDMSGPGYFLPDVPYTMYFHRGYGIHGTYWHSNFGRQMSHGCVNLPINEAQWFFDWAEVGTPVRVV